MRLRSERLASREVYLMIFNWGSTAMMATNTNSARKLKRSQRRLEAMVMLV